MGANCCSHQKEPSEITIIKPEQNIASTSINKTNNNNTNETDNAIQIIDIEQNNKNQNIVNNEFNQDFDYNALQNTSTPLSQKEIDDILNQAFKNADYNQEINMINNNTPLYTQEQIQNQNEGDQNLNLEEILKKQSYQSNTDLDIEEIIKNASNNQNEQINNNNLNLDALFNQQGNTQLDDEYINKIFESTEKLAPNSNDITNNNNPLFLSQRIKPTQIKDMTPLDDKYISSYNSTQRMVDFVPSQLNNNF
jgi:hypothetical protein